VKPVVALLCAVMLAGCGAATAASGPGDQGAVQGHGLQGLVLKPAKPAPALSLHDYTGPRPVSLSAFRGKAVLVTFVYTHCPDVCPLIVSDLAAAQRRMGRDAGRLKILAVTVDPRRDTPAAVRAFLAARGAVGRMDYLLGSRRQLQRTWKAWDVGVQTGPHQLTDGHTSIVYGITASGRMAVVYPSNFSPAQIVHDVPLLASR
jgi:protein SCO1/2